MRLLKRQKIPLWSFHLSISLLFFVLCFVLFRFIGKKLKNKKNIGRYEQIQKRMNLDDVKDKLRKL